jgi:hypothetical protein
MAWSPQRGHYSECAAGAGQNIPLSDLLVSEANEISEVAAEEQSDEDRLPAATGRGLSERSRA